MGGKKKVTAEEMDELDNLPIAELRKRWQRAFKAPLPRGYKRDMIIRGLVHHLQVRANGGLSQSLSRKLRTLAKQLDGEGETSINVGPTLKPGAKLIREWNARTYVVHVTETGFELDGQPYKSLSKIAREITGTRWSGPRFFGVRG